MASPQSFIVSLFSLTLILSTIPTTTQGQRARIRVSELSNVEILPISTHPFEDGAKLVLYSTPRFTNASGFHPSIQVLKPKAPRPAYPPANRIYLLVRVRARNDEVSWARLLYGTDYSKGRRRGGLIPAFDVDDMEQNIYVKREIATRHCCDDLFYLQKLNKRGYLQWTKTWDSGSYTKFYRRPFLFRPVKFVTPNKIFIVEYLLDENDKETFYVVARDVVTGDVLYTVPIRTPPERGVSRRRYPRPDQNPYVISSIAATDSVACVQSIWNAVRVIRHVGVHCFNHKDGTDLRSRLFYKERPLIMESAQLVMHADGRNEEEAVLLLAFRLSWFAASIFQPREYYTEIRRISSRTLRETARWPSGRAGWSKIVLRLPKAREIDGGELRFDEEEEMVKYLNKAEIVLNGRVNKTAENEYTADGDLEQTSDDADNMWVWSIPRTGPPTLSKAE